MAAVWPDYAQLRATAVALQTAPGAQRLRCADGRVRQAATVSALTQTVSLRCRLSAARRTDFQVWAARYAHTWFQWPDIVSGALVAARVRGGRGAIRYAQVATHPGQPYWEASLTLEHRPRSTTNRYAPLGLWPYVARLSGDVQWQDDTLAERSRIDGTGAVRQVQREHAGLQLWQLTAHLAGTHLAAFLAWVYAHHARPFHLLIATDAWQRLRIRDGAAGVRLRQTATRAGDTQWEATLSVAGEGRHYATAELFDAAAPLSRRRGDWGRPQPGDWHVRHSQTDLPLHPDRLDTIRRANSLYQLGISPTAPWLDRRDPLDAGDIVVIVDARTGVYAAWRLLQQANAHPGGLSVAPLYGTLPGDDQQRIAGDARLTLGCWRRH